MFACQDYNDSLTTISNSRPAEACCVWVHNACAHTMPAYTRVYAALKLAISLARWKPIVEINASATKQSFRMAIMLMTFSDCWSSKMCTCDVHRCTLFEWSEPRVQLTRCGKLPLHIQIHLLLCLQYTDLMSAKMQNGFCTIASVLSAFISSQNPTVINDSFRG